MLVFTFNGVINKLKILIPKAVIRGVQLGLGLMLANIALKDYIVKDSHFFDYILVAIAGTIGIILMGNRKYPPAIFIILIGVVYALFFQIENPTSLFSQVKIEIPNFSIPKWNDITAGFLLLALPQIPLSIGNSILATEQITKDLFPEKNISVNKIGITYSLMNIFSAFFSGIPICHGSGGMVGHHSFGARTGGSIVIYGIFFLVIGFFFSANFDEIIRLFPIQILGVILFFEALKLCFLIKDLQAKTSDLYIALFVGLIACSVPYGFLISLILGTILYYNSSKIKLLNS
jgi:MFS superfamily sulfate permease-like transporter